MLLPTLAPACPCTHMVLMLLPHQGPAGRGLPWACAPSTSPLGMMGSPPVSLLRLGDPGGRIWHQVSLPGWGSPGFPTHTPPAF